MNKWKSFWNKIFDILDDFLAYVLTIIGILSSTYIPMLQNTGKITIDIDWGRVIVSAVVALLIISKQEQLTPDKETGDKSKSKEGRKTRFSIRMMNALAQGVMWSQFMQLAK